MIKHLQPLINSNVLRKFNSGSTILYQGEIPRFACVIAKGIVKVYSISANGDEQIVMYHIQGEFFPSSWIFDKAPSTLFFYETVSYAPSLSPFCLVGLLNLRGMSNKSSKQFYKDYASL